MARSPPLHYDQTLFRDPEVFNPTFVPEHLHHRDAQVKELAFLIHPTLQGGRAINAIFRGPPGTGKTTTVLRVFAELKEATRKVIPAYVNCRQNATQTAVYRAIFEEVCGYAPSIGRHLDEIRDGIAARLRDTDARLLVCFDDANYLVAADTYNILLYQLLRLHERWDGVRDAGVFAVTNDLRQNLCAEADGPVWSVFHPYEVNFWPYTRTEVHAILSDRVQQGLYPGVMPTGILDLVSRLTADARDIRVGIDLIRTAVARTEADGRRRVTREDVMCVASGVNSPVLAARTAALSPGERSFLYHLAERSLAGDDMMAGAVYEEMQDYVAAGKTTCHNRLQRLADAGIIDLISTGKGHEVLLRYPPGEIFAACAGDLVPPK
ncbi:MAG TPA: AAA family ATPase [Methanoculleus sp.]|mgnify:CR=1 FL=1|jgi:cell division control protein 6|uniref:AAA family ATPase n=1 Tax=Methanoculleus sp. TaxID=90427 RepID=UPI002B7323C0|nr:AAA family ATPase [Methanoculleus sp.]HNT09047.1 AAA family ATPase [Methanoculleus sp.]HNV39814.1 AAA family ATPase [Methanoculleus sp.]HOC85116.1 AAA family ATPase [Methanoculleus sp.]HOZ44313.1 AAA family ATPase [Methanoculleus sp.]